VTRFLFFTDSHIAGESPRHRTDDFPKAVLDKLRETYSIAESEGCAFVAFGGDWFNSHRLFSFDVISDAMDIVGHAGIRTYAAVGEHDLYGHNLKTYPSSTLAFFVRQCHNMEILWEPLDFGEVVLYGKHEPNTMDEVLNVQVDQSKVNVLVCHELLTCNQAPYDIVSTASLNGCPYDLVLSGDLHDGYPTHKVGSTWFCNPGSLARRTTADANRWPQVAIISVEKGKDPEIEIRRLACGQAGEDVFGASIAEIARSKEDVDMSVNGFAKELLEFEAESTNVHDLVQKAGAKAGIRKEVLEYLAKKRDQNVA